MEGRRRRRGIGSGRLRVQHGFFVIIVMAVDLVWHSRKYVLETKRLKYRDAWKEGGCSKGVPYPLVSMRAHDGPRRAWAHVKLGGILQNRCKSVAVEDETLKI